MDNEPKSSKQIKTKLTDIATPFINQISDKLIVSVNDILKTSNVKFKPTKFEETFKKAMVDNWLEEFNKLWESRKLHEQLTILNAKKLQLQQDGSGDKAWRAHGHTPEQQTQLSRNRVMAVHLMHMQDLLENQTIELKKLILEVEERRNFFNEVANRREKIVANIDSKLIDLQNTLNETE